MSISINSAISAYTNAANVMKNAGDASATSGADAVSNTFSGLIEKPIANTIGSMRSAESAAMGSLSKQVDTTDVVTAVTKAETTLRTVIAVRDRLVSAFQDLEKMPI